MVVGASAGSTSGGLKMLRLNLAIKAGMRELSRIFNPHQIKKIRHNGETISDERLWNIFGVLILWVLLFMGSCLIVALLVIWKHRTNITRLLKGEESKINQNQ